jgi:hypothetical protein
MGDVSYGSGPPRFLPLHAQVPRSAVGSGSGRPEPARPMSQLGRLRRFGEGPANVGYRQLARVRPTDLDVPILGHLTFGAASARRCCRTRVHPLAACRTGV